MNSLQHFTKELSKLKMPYSVKCFGEEDLLRLGEPKVGTVFLTECYGFFINPLNPNKFKHAAIYIGDNKVIEATTHGMKITNLQYFLLTKDEVVAVYPKFQFYPEKILEDFKNYEHAEYDWDFETSSKKLYCFELVAKLLMDCGVGYQAQTFEAYKFLFSLIGKKKIVYSCETFLTKDFELVFINEQAKKHF